MTTPAPQQPVIDHASPAGIAPERFLVLDGLRGLAAFAVILDHVHSATLWQVFSGRYLAVDFFFVLSGFVLAHAYGRRLEGGWSPWAFMRARLIRLYPLYLAGLLMGASYATFGALRGWGGPTLADIAAVTGIALLFLPAPPSYYYFTGGMLYPFNGPAWSLFFELMANMVYGLVARFLTWRVFAVILPLGAATVAFTVMNHPETGGPGWLWPHFDAGLARVLFQFFAGIAVYKLYQTGRLPAIPVWVAVIALLAIMAVPATGLFWRPAYDAFAGIVLMPALVALAAGAKVSGAVARVCTVLGMLSYGVYVLHVPLLNALTLGMQAAHVSLPYGFVKVILVALVATIAATTLHVLYDMPVRRWLSQRFTGRAKPLNPQLPAGEAG